MAQSQATRKNLSLTLTTFSRFASSLSGLSPSRSTSILWCLSARRSMSFRMPRGIGPWCTTWLLCLTPCTPDSRLASTRDTSAGMALRQPSTPAAPRAEAAASRSLTTSNSQLLTSRMMN